jgi:hypothetical protein
MNKKTEDALIAGGAVGGIALLLSSWFPNYNILVPFNPDPTRSPAPDIGKRFQWSLVLGGAVALMYYAGVKGK